MTNDLFIGIRSVAFTGCLTPAPRSSNLAQHVGRDNAYQSSFVPHGNCVMAGHPAGYSVYENTSMIPKRQLTLQRVRPPMPRSQPKRQTELLQAELAVAAAVGIDIAYNSSAESLTAISLHGRNAGNEPLPDLGKYAARIPGQNTRTPSPMMPPPRPDFTGECLATVIHRAADGFRLPQGPVPTIIANNAGPRHYGNAVGIITVDRLSPRSLLDDLIENIDATVYRRGSYQIQ